MTIPGYLEKVTQAVGIKAVYYGPRNVNSASQHLVIFRSKGIPIVRVDEAQETFSRLTPAERKAWSCET